MKRTALVLGALMILGVVSGAAAQGNQPAQNPSGSASGSANVDVKAPSANVDVKTDSQPAARPGVDVNINKKNDTTVRSDRSSDGSALPRSAAGSDRTTIFGLSPTAAVIIAAALLVVVILAIVAMTRSGSDTTYIDRGGRPPVV